MTDVTLTPATDALDNQAAVARYSTHDAAEAAVRQLQHGGIPVQHVSIIGRDFQMREDVQGYYTPGKAALDGAGEGAWYGGLFGLLLGAGFFVFPVAGALFVLGPLAGLVSGAIAGAGIGALATGLVALGVPKDRALQYQEYLQAGEFLVLVHGPAEEVERGRAILAQTSPTSLDTHGPQITA